jgi:hypothetical protein
MTDKRDWRDDVKTFYPRRDVRFTIEFIENILSTHNQQVIEKLEEMKRKNRKAKQNSIETPNAWFDIELDTLSKAQELIGGGR